MVHDAANVLPCPFSVSWEMPGSPSEWGVAFGEGPTGSEAYCIDWWLKHCTAMLRVFSAAGIKVRWLLMGW